VGDNVPVKRYWLSLVLVSLLGAAATPALAEPNRDTCRGYPEKRIWLENQSWWEPQPLQMGHRNAGEQGHIHVGMCFPVYQKVPATVGSTMRFDIKLQLHETSQTFLYFRLLLYGDVHYDVLRQTWRSSRGVDRAWRCDTAHCEQWLTVEFPIGQAQYRGERQFMVELLSLGENGSANWYSITRYPIYIDRADLPLPPAGSVAADVATEYEMLGGDSWVAFDLLGQGAWPSKYARANLMRNSLPFDERTLQLKPLRGTWRVKVRFDRPGQLALVDPDLHNGRRGLVVHDARGQPAHSRRTLKIDTTKLSNGVHKLLLASSNGGSLSRHTGVLVVPFLVKNKPRERR
jgi:hypothetical protein